MFPSKVRAFPTEAPFRLPGPIHKQKTSKEKGNVCKGKHSSLLRKFKKITVVKDLM
jgi:hypothetical protein